MEGRHTRRLVRYWVFLSIAYLLGILAYFYYGTLHALFSSISASVGMIGPRYLMSAIAVYYITGFVLGIVFLGFDVRARDIREGIVEVLDSRPLTNLELVAGRFLALFLAAWVPIVILVLLIQGLGWLLPLLGSPIGRTVEPVSLVNFVVLIAVPALAFAIALVFVITLLVRQRLIAALISIAAIVGVYWLLFTIPVIHAPFVDFLGMTVAGSPSDIVPAVVMPGGGPQRVGVLLVALGLLGLAAVIHPRLDGGDRVRAAAASFGLVLAGIALVGQTARTFSADAELIETWRAAHDARRHEPVADMLSIAGDVRIEPGRSVEAELTVELRAPLDASLDRVLLTLNPGFVVGEARSAAGSTLAASHANGLLDIELERALAPGERTALTLRYRGRPNVAFAYLDAAIRPERLNANEAQISLLGYRAAIFDRRYVALMPGIRWLPAAGADVGRDDSRARHTDYFDVDLDVTLPASWLAAGPGKRQVVGSTNDTVTFRFAPAVSVPEVAIAAGELESFSTEIRGITFEALMHPKHTANLEYLADSREEIEQWIADRLEASADAGLEYPFDAFTVVEVPNSLRGYGGGWRLDTVLAPPGMMLLRETSFPTARFDFNARAAFSDFDPDEQEGGVARVDRDRLVAFFNNDFSGGNVFTGAARSFFAHRTSAAGPGAIALDFVLEELATLFVSGQRSYFSAHLFKNLNQTSSSLVNALQESGSVADAMISSRITLPEVWNVALDEPLADIDPWKDPQRTIDLLTLKGGGTAQALYDTLGPQAVGELLAALLELRAGDSYTLEDVVAAGERVDRDLGGMLEDWVAGTGLAGFVAQRVELYRLPDSGNGDARYQLLVRIANPEPVVGFARVAWTMERGGERAFGEPVRIPGRSAIEYGAVLSQPPAAVYVRPYLSLNRDDFLAGLTDTAEIATRAAEPFDGVREVDIGDVVDERIVADDLDVGFTVVDEEAGSDLRLAGRRASAAGLDNGLPIISIGALAPRVWSRRTNETAWGRYRHTLAYVGAGDGRRRAVMPASIPSPGLWELELHLPFLPFLPPPSRGTWNLEVVTANGREPVAFDATLASLGWNLVGRFELPAGEVRVEISDRTDGRMVIADAIGWSPVRTRSSTIETEAADE